MAALRVSFMCINQTLRDTVNPKVCKASPTVASQRSNEGDHAARDLGEHKQIVAGALADENGLATQLPK